MIRTRFNHAIALAALALTARGGAVAAQQLPPAAEVVEKYMQVTGGHALARFSGRHTITEMSMPAMGMTMTIEVWSARPNRMFSKTEMNGMSITSGFDGTTAWFSSPATGARILDGPEFKQVFDNSSFEGNVDFAKVYPTMETVGERTMEGHACWNVRMVSVSGTEVRQCFDKESGLLVGSTIDRQQTAMGEVTAEVVINEYGTFDGMRIPTRMTTTAAGQQIVTTVKSVSHAPIPDSLFVLPAEVRALRH